MGLIMRNKTLIFTALCFLCGTHPALTSAWLYEKDVIVTSRGPISACDTPSSVDEFHALLKLKDYDAMNNYIHCELILEPIGKAITVDGFDIYIKLMTTINGQPKSFWTRKGLFQSEQDWAASDCEEEKKAKGISTDECSNLFDRERWKRD